MDTAFGFVGKDFVILAADGSESYSILKMKDTEDKIFRIDDRVAIAACGANTERKCFCELIARNIQLFKYRTSHSLSTHAIASFTRMELATALRRGPFMVDGLLGGFDEEEGPSLHFFDYLASSQKVLRGAQGYGGFFLASVMDTFWKPELEMDEAIVIVQKCIQELSKRFLISQTNFIVKSIDKNGIHLLDIN